MRKPILLPQGFSGRNVRVREGEWHYRFKSGGQEYSGSTGLPATKRNQKRAEAIADEERREAEKERHRIEAAPFDRSMGEFIGWCRDVEYRSKPNTGARIKTSAASLVEFFGTARVGNIGPADIEAYKNHRLNGNGVREITLRHDLHALSLFFQYGQKMNWCAANPVEKVTIPSDRDAIREHVVTPEEEEKYFAAAELLHAKYAESFKNAQPNLADLARLMLEQGCRPEEILAARKEHLKLVFRPGAPRAGDAPRGGSEWAENPTGQLSGPIQKLNPEPPISGTLLIAGGKSRAARRTLNLTAASIAILERRKNLDSPWLFPSDRHPGHHLSKLTTTHDRVCREAGVSFVLYDLRHTFATRFVASGGDVVTLGAILGHSGLRCVMRYVHPQAETQRKAMENFEAWAMRGKLKVVG